MPRPVCRQGRRSIPRLRIFRWVPAESQAPGSYRVTFSVSDGWEVDSEEIVITVLDPNPWQNRSNPADVDGDGRVAPLDVLVIINRINRFGAGLLQAHQPGDPYCDVNGDGEIGPVDSLLVINRLNAGLTAEGEAEFSAAVDPFGVGTLGQILPEGTAAAVASPADGPGTVAGSLPIAAWDPYASASHGRLRASVFGHDDDERGWAVPKPRPVAGRRRTGEGRGEGSAHGRRGWVVKRRQAASAQCRSGRRPAGDSRRALTFRLAGRG